MGEALITRRGGGGHKHGTNTNLATAPDYKTISDPALIGVKNAVIYAVSEKIITASSVHTSLVGIFIEDGVITGILNEYRDYIRFVRNPSIAFDSATGTITTNSEKWFYNQSATGAIVYEYIIYD